MSDDGDNDMIVDETIGEEAQENDDDDDGGGDHEVSLDRIKTECSTMVRLLKNLQDEEHNLDCQLKILAREALLCGFTVDLVEPPQPKRRRVTAKKKQTTKQDKAEKRASIGSTATNTSTDPAAAAVAEVVATVMESEAKEDEHNIVEAEIVTEDHDQS